MGTRLARLRNAFGTPWERLLARLALTYLEGHRHFAHPGLLDARGTALVRALAARGLQPRAPRGPLSSAAELRVWLDEGPLLMDGARWFGQGHWLVAVGYDQAGISSGGDTRYLTWLRLYGEVGFRLGAWVSCRDQQPESTEHSGRGRRSRPTRVGWLEQDRERRVWSAIRLETTEFD
jgi:hypothetical protein